MELENFAANLRTLRQKAGLSQEALAARLGVSGQSVSKWENAANWPETALILPLARLFGVSADELLSGPASREEWEDRWQAVDFFKEGVMACDGSEKERYTNILLKLLAGETECSDS